MHTSQVIPGASETLKTEQDVKIVIQRNRRWAKKANRNPLYNPTTYHQSHEQEFQPHLSLERKNTRSNNACTDLQITSNAKFTKTQLTQSSCCDVSGHQDRRSSVTEHCEYNEKIIHLLKITIFGFLRS